MRRRVVAGLIPVLLAFAAQPGASVEEVIAAVRSGIAKHDSDGSIARSLRRLKPAERLDDRVIEELESEGAGAKSVAALERLRDESRDLQPPATPPVFRHDPAPLIAEQRKIVNAAQSVALNYAGALPDFICAEVIRRYDDSRGSWDLKDTLEIRLTYFDRTENYRLLMLNGRPTTRDFLSMGGALSEGEFGTMLYSLFAPKSKTVFRWDHWTTLRGRKAHVFTFRIAAENSMYRVQVNAGSADRSGIVAGQHGFVYVDAGTDQILRIMADADSIPSDFPVREASTVLDYDFTPIGGNSFLLPLRAEVRMGTAHLHTRNRVEFQAYRKFAGESTITFH